MSTSIGLPESSGKWESPPSKLLDQRVWEVWTAKGRAQERQASARRVTAVKLVSIAALIAAAGLGPSLWPYEVVVRFLVTAGAIAMMFQAFQARFYVSAAVFGALALIYNPVAPMFPMSGGWPRAILLASAVPFAASLAWHNAGRHKTKKLIVTASKAALIALPLLGALAHAGRAGDLSRYREFQFGSDVADVAKLSGSGPDRVKDVYRRPVLIQELDWHPQSLGPTTTTEPAQEIVFSFYDGELFRIVVDYDRYETEGLTSDDIIESISATYGVAAVAGLPKAAQDPFGEHEELVARWQDSQCRFDLIRSSRWPSFRLVAVLKRLEAPAQAAMLEAKRLDELEAPQRDAARIVSQEAAAKAALEKARLLNKAKFRP